MESKNKKMKELYRAHFQHEHILSCQNTARKFNFVFRKAYKKKKCRKKEKKCRKKKLFILLPVKGRCLNRTVISDVLKYSQHLCRKHAARIIISSHSDLCILSFPV